MTYKESMLNPCGGQDYWGFRFVCKKMASIVLVRGKRRGRFPLRRIARAVSDGIVTAHELSLWYPMAVKALREG